ncbi:MAG: DUF421 domain-containing protein [Bacteroidetes bacterium]|nr:DUF421 domain-containing protein [Bacteroidota bacterium]
MEILKILFGEGKHLDTLQMCDRGIVVFILALILIRISGRRSFGLKTPIDNIISILLGAVLSRAVVGASPFGPTLICCLVIVCLHRSIGWLIVRHDRVARWIEGHRILIFDDGRFKMEQLKRGLVGKEDIMQGVRKSALTEDLSKVDKIYLERNGDISPVMKNK